MCLGGFLWPLFVAGPSIIIIDKYDIVWGKVLESFYKTNRTLSYLTYCIMGLWMDMQFYLIYNLNVFSEWGLKDLIFMLSTFPPYVPRFRFWLDVDDPVEVWLGERWVRNTWPCVETTKFSGMSPVLWHLHKDLHEGWCTLTYYSDSDPDYPAQGRNLPTMPRLHVGAAIMSYMVTITSVTWDVSSTYLLHYTTRKDQLQLQLQLHLKYSCNWTNCSCDQLQLGPTATETSCICGQLQMGQLQLTNCNCDQ